MAFEADSGAGRRPVGKLTRRAVARFCRPVSEKFDRVKCGRAVASYLFDSRKPLTFDRVSAIDPQHASCAWSRFVRWQSVGGLLPPSSTANRHRARGNLLGGMMKTKLAILGAIAFAISTPAFAVVTPFGGPATGVDPLGNAYAASGTHWGSPGYGAGTIAFNPLHVSNSNGSYATSFSFTFLKGVKGLIDQTPAASPFGFLPQTRFTNVTDGVAWLASFDGNAVTFTAPTMAAKLDAGDLFFVNVAFTGPVDKKKFSFAGLWDDTKVASPAPEPASWAMIIVGFGALGSAMRRQKAKLAVA
jgi:hypothetical protein